MWEKVCPNAYAGEHFWRTLKIIGLREVRCVHYLLSPDEKKNIKQKIIKLPI